MGILAASPLDPFHPDLIAIHPALRLRVSVRAKRLALRLDTKDGKIDLVVPKRASLKKALQFANEYRDWINRHADGLAPAIRFCDGAVIPVLGRDRVIRVAYDPDLKRTTITLHDDTLAVRTNKDDPSGRITRFLKTLARDEINRLARAKATQINRAVTEIQIRDTTSRWGSCSPDGVLSFSWRLILAPYESLDYVVAHEVAHLVHLNHKSRFWALCEKLSENFETGHNWMKTQGQSLMRYG